LHLFHSDNFYRQEYLSTNDVKTLVCINQSLYTTIKKARASIITNQDPTFSAFDFNKQTLLFNPMGEWCAFGGFKNKPGEIQILFGDATSLWRHYITDSNGNNAIKRAVPYISSRIIISPDLKKTAAIFRIPKESPLHGPNIVIVPSLHSVWDIDYSEMDNKRYLTYTMSYSLYSRTLFNHALYLTQQNTPIILKCNYGVKPTFYQVTIKLDHPEFADIRARIKTIKKSFDVVSCSKACHCSTDTIDPVCQTNYDICNKLLHYEDSTIYFKKTLHREFATWHNLCFIDTIEDLKSDTPCTTYANPFGELIVKKDNKKHKCITIPLEEKLRSYGYDQPTIPWSDAASMHASEFKKIGNSLHRTLDKTIFIFDPLKSHVTSGQFNEEYTVIDIINLNYTHKSSVVIPLTVLFLESAQGTAALWYYTRAGGPYHHSNIPIRNDLHKVIALLRDSLDNYPAMNSFCVKGDYGVMQEAFKLIQNNKLLTSDDKDAQHDKKEKCVIS